MGLIRSARAAIHITRLYNLLTVLHACAARPAMLEALGVRCSLAPPRHTPTPSSTRRVQRSIDAAYAPRRTLLHTRRLLPPPQAAPGGQEEARSPGAPGLFVPRDRRSAAPAAPRLDTAAGDAAGTGAYQQAVWRWEESNDALRTYAAFFGILLLGMVPAVQVSCCCRREGCSLWCRCRCCDERCVAAAAAVRASAPSGPQI